MLLRDNRSSKKRGILLPLSALPSSEGIGTLGEEAYRLIDFLAETEQDYWQILPLCPLGKGNSPYTSISAFAGEILYIDLSLLSKDGLLKKEEITPPEFPKNIDYKKVRKFKTPLLFKAAGRFDKADSGFKKFKKENKDWLRDFAYFCAIKESELGISFTDWEDGLKYRLPKYMLQFYETHEKEIEIFEILQYFFFSQYERLHRYAKEKNIKIIGDIPFYVSPESADVWANGNIFKLGHDMRPLTVAGVPPDIFSCDGQLWGNPIYDWEYLKRTDYRWWRERLCHNARLYDVIRIDHFRAFADFYSIPANAETARQGRWEKGAGIRFWQNMKPYLKNTEIIAEDLGGEDSPIVQDLVVKTGFPNMKVLHFAFDSDLEDPFLPRNFGENCVCYTGTHDNDTTLGWFNKLTSKEKVMFDRLVPKKYNSPVLNLISYAIKSKARITIIPFQDYLQLDSSHRINIPGVPKGNWEWRFSKEDITDELKDLIKNI